MSRRWASGGPRSPVTLPLPAPEPAGPEPAPPAEAGPGAAGRRLSDTALRDVGVLGLAVCLTGSRNQRLVLRD